MREDRNFEHHIEVVSHIPLIARNVVVALGGNLDGYRNDHREVGALGNHASDVT